MAAVAALAAGLPVTAAVAARSAPGGSWSGPRELLQPRDSAGSGYFGALSCASRSDCTAVGIYADRSGGDRVFAITERHGAWGRALGIAIPAASKTINVALPLLSCASAGNCTAGGDYDVRRQSVAFVVSETNGTWGQPHQVRSNPTDISCPAPGDCMAVLARGYLLSQTHGIWGTAFPVPGLAALDHGRPVPAQVITCPSPGNCTTAGSYSASAAPFDRGFVATERHGTWGRAQPVTSRPADALALTLLSCPSAGNCVAGGGIYPPAGSPGAFAVTESHGTWGTAQTLPGTSQPGAGGISQLDCTAAGACSAAGDFVVPHKPEDLAEPFVSVEKNGTWHTAQTVAGARPGSALDWLSCAAAGNCVLAGGIVFHGQIQAGSAAQVNGRWGPAGILDGIRALDHGQPAQIEAVSCPARSGCTAVGSAGRLLAGLLFVTAQHPA